MCVCVCVCLNLVLLEYMILSLPLMFPHKSLGKWSACMAIAIVCVLRVMVQIAYNVLWPQCLMELYRAH